MVSEKLPTYYGIEKEDIQVVTPRRLGDGGSMNLNYRLQNIMTRNRYEVEKDGYRYRLGDKVIHMRNDYKYQEDDSVVSGQP